MERPEGAKKSLELRKGHRLRELAGLGLAIQEVEAIINDGLRTNILAPLTAKVAELWFGLNSEQPHTYAEIAKKLDRPKSRVSDEVNYAVRFVLEKKNQTT